MYRKGSNNGPSWGRKLGARKLLATAMVVSGLGAVAGLGTFAAFSATDTNDGNTITTGTIAIAEHTGTGVALYSLTDQGGSASSKCVRVTYTGTLTGTVRLYVASPANGDKYNLKVERSTGGTPITTPASDMNCTGFVAGSAPYDGLLSAFPTTYAAGVDGKATNNWTNGNTEDYKFTITPVDGGANTHTTDNDTGSHVFTWEAQNQ